MEREQLIRQMYQNLTGQDRHPWSDSVWQLPAYEGFIYNDTLIPTDLVNELIRDQILEPVGKQMHQGVPMLRFMLSNHFLISYEDH